MGRRKKSVEVVENPVEMKEDALNLPVEEVAEEKTEEKIEEPVEVKAEVPVKESVVADVEVKEPVVVAEPVKKRIKSTSSLVNVRATPDGEVLFRIKNETPILVEKEEGEWVKVTGYVMKALVGEL